jgi:hypothetical protein
MLMASSCLDIKGINGQYHGLKDPIRLPIQIVPGNFRGAFNLQGGAVGPSAERALTGYPNGLAPNVTGCLSL